MPRIQDRQRVVSIRLTRAEHAASQAEAQAAGAPIGVLLRLRMLDAHDLRERLAALEAAAAAHTEALALLERSIRTSFRSLAAMLEPGRPVASAPGTTTAPTNPPPATPPART